MKPINEAVFDFSIESERKTSPSQKKDAATPASKVSKNLSLNFKTPRASPRAAPVKLSQNPQGPKNFVEIITAKEIPTIM